MSAYYPNWSAVLKDIVKYITEFKLKPPLVAVEQTFKITLVATNHFTIENITVPLSPALVYEITPTEILTYNPANKWESFLILSGKNGVWSGRVPPGFGNVISVNGQSDIVVIDKVSVGLPLVDNTPDTDKIVSNPTQAALNLKVTANSPIVPGTGSKITWGENGLVLSGGQLSTNDIVETVNRRFLSEQQWNDLNTVIEDILEVSVDGGDADDSDVPDPEVEVDGGNA